MLDTDTCIALIKGESAAVQKKLRGKSISQVGISSIGMSELMFGAAHSARPEQNYAALHEFLLALEVAPYDSVAATEYGKVRSRLIKTGKPIGAHDLFIAAHALSLDAVLVTHNAREFSRVSGLRCEDWLAA